MVLVVAIALPPQGFSASNTCTQVRTQRHPQPCVLMILVVHTPVYNIGGQLPGIGRSEVPWPTLWPALAAPRPVPDSGREFGWDERTQQVGDDRDHLVVGTHRHMRRGDLKVSGTRIQTGAPVDDAVIE